MGTFLRFFLLIFLLLLPICVAPAPWSAAGSAAWAGDTAMLRDAVRAADTGQYSRAIALAKRAGFPFMVDALRGEAYAKDALGDSEQDIYEFLAGYPAFPERRAMLATAEKYMVPNDPPRNLDRLYQNASPVTLNGVMSYINWLMQNGERGKAEELMRDRWVNGPLASGDDSTFRNTYQQHLTSRDDFARLDRLIYQQETVAAGRMYPLLGGDYQALAEARFALQRGDIDGPTKMNRVPRHLQNDPGLLYARIKYRRDRDDTRGAAELLGQISEAPGDPAAWWRERHIIIRRMIEARDWRTAYNLAAQHGLQPGGKTAGDYASAEFLAGWLALRFVNDPRRAEVHFGNLYNNVSQPVSKSRGAYWLGRAYEAQGDKQKAAQWYGDAANYPFFFYGQLGMAKLGQNTITYAAEPAMPPEVRQRFQRQPLVQIIKAYTNIRETERARRFLRALLPTLGTRAEYAYAAELAHAISPHTEVETAKAANAKGFTLTGDGYPTVRLGSRTQPEAALTLGLIRQESQFQSDVESPAGAVGLMQLLTSSARGIAKKYSEPFRGKTSLYDPNTNITLGRHYLSDRIDQFGGSYIKAIAAYNAGQGRVRQWESIVGDPKAGMDPIDWIEMLPIYETRNYVQRVLEGTQVYRAVLNGGSAPLRITADLSR